MTRHFMFCKDWIFLPAIHFKYIYLFQVKHPVLLKLIYCCCGLCYDVVFRTVKKLMFPYNLKRRGVRDKSSEGI